MRPVCFLGLFVGPSQLSSQFDRIRHLLKLWFLHGRTIKRVQRLCLVLHFFLSATTITIWAESSTCFGSTFTWFISNILVISRKVLVGYGVKVLVDKGVDCVNIVGCVSVMLCDRFQFAFVTHLSFEWVDCAALDVHLLVLSYSAPTSANNINASVHWLIIWSLDSVEFYASSLLFRSLLLALLLANLTWPAVLVVTTKETLNFLALGKCLGLLHRNRTLIFWSVRSACAVVPSRTAGI